jgi:hypothetical protein
MSGRPTCEASRRSGFVPDLTHEQWARIDAAAFALDSRVCETLTGANGPVEKET